MGLSKNICETGFIYGLTLCETFCKIDRIAHKGILSLWTFSGPYWSEYTEPIEFNKFNSSFLTAFFSSNFLRF